MKELEQRITENGIDYILIGDYYYPDLELPKDEEPHYGKYGNMRLNYIKEHKRAYIVRFAWRADLYTI